MLNPNKDNPSRTPPSSTSSKSAPKSPNPAPKFNPDKDIHPVPVNGEYTQDLLVTFMESIYNQVIQTRSNKDAGEELAAFLKQSGVKMIAVDFDNTLLHLHTRGVVSRNGSDALQSVVDAFSKDFNQFGALCRREGIRICVVTFSDSRIGDDNPNFLSGKELVLTVLRQAKAAFQVDEIYPYLPVFYEKESEYCKLGLKTPMRKNKSYHLRRLCYEFELEPYEVCLVDDDENNCIGAVKEGYCALHVDGKGFTYESLNATPRF